MAQWETYLREHQARLVEELLDFVRIPSLSALPEHDADVRWAAEWVAARLRAAGIANARTMPTDRHPVVYGEWLGAPGKPTVLLYGHFDVQPVDPLSLWTSPPFEPTIRDGRVYARGASDMKGNLLLTIAAVEALLATTDRLPVNVKLLFEGQEEVGSTQLPAFLAANRDPLACDFVVSGDGIQWSESEPSLLVGLRGTCRLEIDVEGANTDLHSGLYGGSIANPLHALAELLASLHTPDGRVAVEGFYSDVAPLSAEDRAHFAAVPFDEAKFAAQLGVPEVFGEPGYTTYERIWARPTLELVGMWGGYQGEGNKTVLPREAHAKVSCRLVPNQEPPQVLELLQAHVAKHAPRGVKVTVRPGAAMSEPYLVPADHPGQEAACRVLAEVYGREPYHTRMGGSVPVCGMLLRELGAHTIPFGFGLMDEPIHAPNEFFRLSSFERGQVAYCRLLETVGQVP